MSTYDSKLGRDCQDSEESVSEASGTVVLPMPHRGFHHRVPEEQNT